MGLPPHELLPDEAAFVEFSELVLTHFAMRAQPLRRFSDRQLRSLSMPILVDVGVEDVVFYVARVRRRLATGLPQTTVLAIPNIGDSLPDQSSTVLEFLMRTLGSSGTPR